MKTSFPAVTIAFLLLAGCSGIGPGTVPRDRFNYNQAISKSWKEQTLLNIVKIRYADMPLFVEVASVVSGYTLESQASIGGQLSSPDAVQGDSFTLGGSGKYTDRPTITYSPITGKTFNENFMTPIPPRAVLFLIQSGWPADLIFPMTVQAINGYRARVAAGVDQRTGDPKFYRIIALFREIQKSGAVGMRVLKETDASETTVLFFLDGISNRKSKPHSRNWPGCSGSNPAARKLRSPTASSRGAIGRSPCSPIPCWISWWTWPPRSTCHSNTWRPVLQCRLWRHPATMKSPSPN